MNDNFNEDFWWVAIDEYVNSEIMEFESNLNDYYSHLQILFIDEHDVENEDILPEEAYIIKVDGDSSIRDLNREYGWKLPDDEAATIAGLIIHETRSIPKKGSIYSFHGFRFKILDRQRNQLTSIRIQKEI